jgi:site-specific DNA recombinase
LPKDKIERFVIDRIKQHILTEKNPQELTKLTNEQLCERCEQERERIQLLDSQIAQLESRLGKLYDALETGEFKGGELAPRITVLAQKKEEFRQARAEAEEALDCQMIQLADRDVVRAYVTDLKQLLERSELVEQKALLKEVLSIGV